MRSRRNPIRWVALFGVLMLLLAACASDADDDATTVADPADTSDEATEDAQEPTEDPTEAIEASEDADEDGVTEDEMTEEEGDGASSDGQVDRAQFALDEPFELTVGAIPGAQAFIMYVMQEQGLHEDYNLQLTLSEVLSPPALHVAVAEKQVDIGFAGITAAVQARSEGRETVIVNMLSSPNNLVLTPEDSDIETLDDLRGERWGTFSGPSATTFQILEALVDAEYGWDLRSESEYVEAPDPALAGLMRQGELVAALMGGTGSLSVFLEGDFRIVSDISEDWEANYGALPAHVSVASNDEFVEANPEVVVAFNAAFYDTLDYIDANPQIWEAYAEDIELPEGGAEQLQQRLATRFIRSWDEEQMDAQVQLLELLIAQADDGAFVEEIPEGMFRLDLQPDRYEG